MHYNHQLHDWLLQNNANGMSESDWILLQGIINTLQLILKLRTIIYNQTRLLNNIFLVWMFTVFQSTAIGNPNTGEKIFNYLFQPFFKDWIQTDRSSHPERSMRNFSVPILISKQPVQSKEYWPSHIQLSELLLPAFPHLVNTQSRAHCWVTKTPR